MPTFGNLDPDSENDCALSHIARIATALVSTSTLTMLLFTKGRIASGKSLWDENQIFKPAADVSNVMAGRMMKDDIRKRIRPGELSV
jgi:hypothetical protein